MKSACRLYRITGVSLVYHLYMRLKNMTASVCLVFLISMPTLALACECAAIPLESRITSADTIFSGTLIATSSAPGVYTMQFSVSSVWKGSAASISTVYTPLTAGCGWAPPRGEEYVVFTMRAPSGQLITDYCSGNQPRADSPVPSLLGAGRAPQQTSYAEITTAGGSPADQIAQFAQTPGSASVQTSAEESTPAPKVPAPKPQVKTETTAQAGVYLQNPLQPLIDTVVHIFNSFIGLFKKK